MYKIIFRNPPPINIFVKKILFCRTFYLEIYVQQIFFNSRLIKLLEKNLSPLEIIIKKKPPYVEILLKIPSLVELLFKESFRVSFKKSTCCITFVKKSSSFKAFLFKNPRPCLKIHVLWIFF